ncbi:MAG TPA: glycosyltransferase family 4 protein [Puia sp.]|jgi:glycosyltransferase involved in cell wall biosynthesis
MEQQKKILLFADWYEPGYKAGGPIRSCINFARRMQENYQVYVFTSDRDLDSTEPYTGVMIDQWITMTGGVKVFYCSPTRLSWKEIRQQLDAIQPDFIYLNSMFSMKFTIFPLLMGWLYRLNAKIILSPRGMLRTSAVQFKSLKKRIFFKYFRLLRLHRHIRFLASDDTEVNDVRRYFGRRAEVMKIPNFSANLPDRPDIATKKQGEVSMIYIGRVHPIKNTDYLLNVLKGVKADVLLTIVGSLEDKKFWQSCEEIIAGLPSNILVKYAGELPNQELPGITAAHHIFVLPTRGENFGHAIFEALVLGKPVLISDQTPWRDLTIVKAGWDLALDQPALFVQVIEQVAAFDQEEYRSWSLATREYVEAYMGKFNWIEEYKKLFS